MSDGLLAFASLTLIVNWHTRHCKEQSAVRFKFVFLHEQFPRHPFVQPHFTHFRQLAVTSGRLVQNGCQPSVWNTQPYSGDGKCGHGLTKSTCPQQWTAWYTALLVCCRCSNAAWVGGIASKGLPFWPHNCILASFTLTLLLVLS